MKRRQVVSNLLIFIRQIVLSELFNLSYYYYRILNTIRHVLKPVRKEYKRILESQT